MRCEVQIQLPLKRASKFSLFRPRGTWSFTRQTKGHVKIHSSGRAAREVTLFRSRSTWSFTLRPSGKWSSTLGKKGRVKFHSTLHVKFYPGIIGCVKFHSSDQGVCEISLFRPRCAWSFTLRPRGAWSFTLTPRGAWSFTLQTKVCVKFHSSDQGVREISLFRPRGAWSFTLRARRLRTVQKRCCREVTCSKSHKVTRKLEPLLRIPRYVVLCFQRADLPSRGSRT
jgi:hypothetical protein